MHRRSFLAASGTASLSGCLLVSAGNDDPPVGQVDCQPETDERPSGTASEPATVDGRWPSFQYDNRNSGFNPDASGPRSCPGTLWRYRVSPTTGHASGVNYTVMTAPVIHDATLYACDNANTLYALNAATGTEQWTMDLRGSYIYGPTYADGSLYLTSDRHLVAIDVESRSERWVRAEPSPNGTIDVTKQGWMEAAPAVVDDRVFAGTFHGLFCAFDADSGELLWHRSVPKRHPPLGGEGKSFTDGPHHDFKGQPAVYDGVVYVANNNGRLYAFDVETGEEIWFHQPGDRLDYAPTVHDGTVYVTGAGGIYAVSTTDGTREWTYGREDDQITHCSPAIAGDTLVAVAGSWQGERKLVALDARSGELQWQTPAIPTSRVSSPSIAGETVVMVLRGGLVAVELATGRPLWTTSANGQFEAPVLVDDLVFSADGDGYVYAIR